MKRDPAGATDPATWERLRQDLLRLRDADPSVLDQYPAPEPAAPRSPVEIRLATHAESTAAALHAAYGDVISLRVGALPYPPEHHSSSGAVRGFHADAATPTDPTEMTFELDGALTVRSGHTATHGLLVTNRTDTDISVATNGRLTAVIVDDTGRPVGGYAGGQTQALVTFTTRPSQTTRIPLLVGTASFIAQLGYVVPPGAWHLQAPLTLGDGRHLRTPALAMTVTD